MGKFTIDLAGDKVENLDRGRNADPGWYRAVLEDAYDDAKSGRTVLEWSVMAPGTWKGQKLFDRVSDPSTASSDSAAAITLRRIKLLGKRLGLIRPEHENHQIDLDFLDAIGGEFVVEYVHRRYQDEGGNWQTSAEVAFDGVYPLDHPKIPENVRKALELPPARAEAGIAPPPQAERPAGRGKGRADAAANGKPPLSPAGQAASQATPPAAVDVSDL
jgi:hypothetical protein